MLCGFLIKLAIRSSQSFVTHKTCIILQILRVQAYPAAHELWCIYTANPYKALKISNRLLCGKFIGHVMRIFLV
jgi:hypothetical protein